MHKQCTCTWNRFKILTASLPLTEETVWILLQMRKDRYRLKDVCNLYLLECWLSAGKTFPSKPRKCCGLEFNHLDGVIFTVLGFVIGVLLHNTCPFVAFYQILVHCIYLYVFENKKVSDNACESVFQLLVKCGCIKCWKSKDFMLVASLKFIDLRYSKYTL